MMLMVSLLCQRHTFSGLKLFSPVSLTLLVRQSTKFFGGGTIYLTMVLKTDTL